MYVALDDYYSYFKSGLQCDEPQPEQLAEDGLDPSRRSQEDLHRGQVHPEGLQQYAWSTGHLQGTTQIDRRGLEEGGRGTEEGNV